MRETDGEQDGDGHGGHTTAPRDSAGSSEASNTDGRRGDDEREDNADAERDDTAQSNVVEGRGGAKGCASTAMTGRDTRSAVHLLLNSRAMPQGCLRRHRHPKWLLHPNQHKWLRLPHLCP